MNVTTSTDQDTDHLQTLLRERRRVLSERAIQIVKLRVETREDRRVIHELTEAISEREQLAGEPMKIHCRWCQGCIACWPEAEERESDI